MMAVINKTSISKMLYFTQKSLTNGQRGIFTSSTDRFQVTAQLWGEPLKKKKRIDPMITKARVDRKKRRIEKEIRKQERNVLQFKPLDELEVPSSLMKSVELRQREVLPLSEDEEDWRFRVAKEWCHYKFAQHQQDFIVINKALKATNNALKELKLESEELYEEAIQADMTLFPFKCKGPVHTPAIEGFEPVDGDYFDVTKKWE